MRSYKGWKVQKASDGMMAYDYGKWGLGVGGGDSELRKCT